MDQVLRHIKRDSWLRILLRIVLPFFMNDHLIGDYADAIILAQSAQQPLKHSKSSSAI